MSDDTTMHGPRDRTRISIDDDDDITYWTREFACSAAALRAAVTSTGASVGDVQKWLGRGRYRSRSLSATRPDSRRLQACTNSVSRAGCEVGDD